MATNEYFDNATLAALPKGQKARAESVDAKFDAITVGMDKMPSVSETSNGNRNFSLAAGSANTYTMTLTHISSYVDGLAVQFRIDTGNANTGASTLDVSGNGPSAIVYPDNTALIAADLPVGSIASVIYSSALSKWVIQSVTQGNVNAAVASASGAATAQGLSEDARDASVTAQGLSEDARDTSVTAQGLSEDARDASVTAQGLSEDAQALSEAWASEVEDTPVSGGLFSALHYAAKAAASSINSVLLTGAQTVQGLKDFADGIKLGGTELTSLLLADASWRGDTVLGETVSSPYGGGTSVALNAGVDLAVDDLVICNYHIGITKGATAGIVGVRVSQSGGTGTLGFSGTSQYYDERHVDAGVSQIFSGTVIFQVATAGSVILDVVALSVGSDSSGTIRMRTKVLSAT